MTRRIALIVLASVIAMLVLSSIASAHPHAYSPNPGPTAY